LRNPIPKIRDGTHLAKDQDPGSPAYSTELGTHRWKAE